MHPKHISITVRITKESVAREARKNPVTLYRLPDVVAHETPQKQTIPAAEARRKALIDEISELKRKNALLVAEQFRLRRLLAADDTLLSQSPPSHLKAASEKKRLIHSQRHRLDD
jgi:hypothetical protein